MVKQRIYIPRIHVASIETCGCVASFNKTDGQLTVWMTTQAPHAIRTVFALVAGHVGLSEEKIRIISPDIGGGFGGKVPVYPGYVIAVAASVVTASDQVDRGPHGGTSRRTRSRATTHGRGAGRGQGRQDHRPFAIKTVARPRVRGRGRQPVQVPGRALLGGHGLLRHQDPRSSRSTGPTQQGAGRDRLPVLLRVTEAAHAIERMTDMLAQK